MSVDKLIIKICEEIKNKYKVENPVFIFNFKVLDDSEVEKWFNDYAGDYSLWGKYKYLEENKFELKPFSPDPDDSISMFLISNFLGSFPKTNKKKWFAINYVKEDFFDYDTTISLS